MLLNVSLDNIVCDLLTHGAKKVALFPQMACPKLFPYTRIFVKYFAARDTFQNRNHLRDRIAWWKRNENVNMIFRYLTLLNLEVKLAGYFEKKLSNPFTYLTNQYSFSVLRTPYQMVCCFIDRMTRAAQCHAFVLIGKQPFLNPHQKNPMRL